MLDEMGILRTSISIEHPARRGTLLELSDVIIDTGSEYTWVPRPVLESLGLTPERVVEFVTTDGRQIERGVGFANIYTEGTSTPDIVVFAESGDLVLLGAHTLEGLNLRIDLVTRRLVHGGPVPAAGITRTSSAIFRCGTHGRRVYAGRDGNLSHANLDRARSQTRSRRRGSGRDGGHRQRADVDTASPP
jgi:predicted aspartyl protease